VVGSDYCGVTCRAGDEPRLARAFAAFLSSQPFDELCLDGMLRGDPLLCALEGVIPAPRAEVDFRYRCPNIAIDGDFDAYLAALPEGAGQQFKRRLRWLQKQPGFAIDRVTAPDEVVRGFDTLFLLHHKRWAVEGGSEAINSPVVEAFHGEE